MTTTTANSRTSAAASRSESAMSLLSFCTERRISYAVLLACLTTLALLHFAFMRANNETVDEFVHLQAGYRYWQCGEFANNPEHPPLMKLVAAWPIRHWQLSGYPFACGAGAVEHGTEEAIGDALLMSPHASEMLWKARAALLVFPILLLLAMFFAAKSWFGDGGAMLAAALFTVEPTLVAHGSLVTTDAALATFTFITLWQGIEAVRRLATWRFIVTGLALGLALASKHSGAVLPILLLIALVVASRFQTARAISAPKLAGWWLGM